MENYFEGFQSDNIRINEINIFFRKSGKGKPLLLLHGFPETHLMWRDVARFLALKFTVICADLPGYGNSGCPASAKNHEPYSKRAMAVTMVELMAQLGFNNFNVIGHDRGGRVTYRMALDFPDKIRCLSVLDIIPTYEAWNRANADFALAFWPWTLLAQPEPLPEKLILKSPDTIIDNAINEWGSDSSVFPSNVRTEYIKALQSPGHVHAICEEYRAAATIDREHDRADLEMGRKINCPMQVLWSKKGSLNFWYEASGGPLAIWKKWALNVQGVAVDGGHFFPEEKPDETAGFIIDFLENFS